MVKDNQDREQNTIRDNVGGDKAFVGGISRSMAVIGAGAQVVYKNAERTRFLFPNPDGATDALLAPSPTPEPLPPSPNP